MEQSTAVFEALESCQITASQFFLSVLTHRQYDNHPVVKDLLLHSPDILSAFLMHPSKNNKSLQHSAEFIKDSYLRELRDVVSEESGWHFGASNATTKQLEDFDIEDMARDMERRAPGLWYLLGALLDGVERSSWLEDAKLKEPEQDAITNEEITEASYWDEVDEIDLEGFIEGLTAEGGPKLPTRDSHVRRLAAIRMIVSVQSHVSESYAHIDRDQKKTVIFSILMQSMNWKCNALQSILGIFLQSAHAPQKVVGSHAWESQYPPTRSMW